MSRERAKENEMSSTYIHERALHIFIMIQNDIEGILSAKHNRIFWVPLHVYLYLYND